MSVRLTVTQRSEAGSSAKPVEHVLDEASITLGRDKGCQVVLAQQAVSRNHARISQEGNLFFLEDLGSAYGTQINGKPLPKGEKHRLRNGDVIAIAQFDVTFTHVADLPMDGGGRSDKTSFVARSLVKDAVRGIKSGEGPYFRVMNGPREGERIELSDAQELVIGRDETADVIFKDDLVSRRHVKIRRDWAGTHVEDLGSRNGIKVNKKKINRKTLKDSDELEVGNIRLLYVDPTDLPEPAVDLPDSADDVGDGDDDEHTQSIPAGRVGSRRARAKEEEQKAKEEERAKEEPQEEEPQEEAPPEPVAEPPPPEPEPEPEPPRPLPQARSYAASVDDGGDGGGGFDKQKMVPLVLMGVFALLAIGLIIAVLAGA
jgi:pSer/pThr/pTyr-binding forkhead associated (FHA) protein